MCSSDLNVELIKYLEKNRDGAKYLLATFGAQAAASFITSTGEPVLPIGGFDGQDPTPTLDEFKALISKNQLRYVQLGGGMFGRDRQNGSNEISNWVSTHCALDTNAPVNESLYTCSNTR